MTATAIVRPPHPAPFVATLRTRPASIQLCASAEPCLTIRVEMPEVWDAVRVDTPPGESIRTIKTRALELLYPDADYPDDFVIKLNGKEIRDEDASVAEVGATDGSIFLLTFRRRRPVRV